LNIELFLANGDRVFDAGKVCVGDIVLASSRSGGPASLRFNIVRDGIVDFVEGNRVVLKVDGVSLFSGIVFTKSRDKNQIISVVVYDQIRYLRNRDSYVFCNITASQIVRMIANDFRLEVGEIEDTGYVIPARSCNNKTLMDMIYTGLDMTFRHTGRMFVLFDDLGRLSLKSVENMSLPLVLASKGGLIDYNYETSIDRGAFNRVKLSINPGRNQLMRYFTANDEARVREWGVLQYTEHITEDYNDAQMQNLAQTMLLNKNKVARTLNLEAFGDVRVKAGNCIYVHIPNIGDLDVNRLLMINRCTHIFRNDEHIMRLEMEGDLD